MIEGGFSEADRQILLSLMYEDSLLLVQEDLVAAGILSNKIKPHSIYKKKERCLQKLRAMLAQKGLNKEAFFT